MPLIVVSGLPCSGKTTAAARLAELLRQDGQEVVVVGEEELHLDRNSCYESAAKEKDTRALLKSTVDRNLTQGRVVILDSLNYIKGVRYELWCLARQAATRLCVLHVDTPAEDCQQWNAERGAAGYREDILEGLVARYERPDSRSRWDSPLVTLRPLLGVAHAEEQLAAAAALVTQGAATTSAGGQVSKELRPTVATASPALSSTNLLYELDRAAQSIVSAVNDAQSLAGAGAPGRVAFGEGLPTLDVQRPVTLAELRRHKRSFMRLATNSAFSRAPGAAATQRMFIGYLAEQLEGAAG